MTLLHHQLVGAFRVKGERRFKVREKALVQMRSWQEIEERVWVHGAGGSYAPETVCPGHGAVIAKRV